ncbi:PRANC domain-containing protein [Orientia tsutsugamushi]|uniref:PRANC domain-containing protein n=1 Tax=Orientia tsutsugamushi TaxID=784 RepID=UPI0040469FD6
MEAFKHECKKEIEEMKRTKTSIGISVLEMFVKNVCINTIARCGNNPDMQIYQNKFHIYLHYIQARMEEGQKRAKLLQGAVESMSEIFESNHDALQEDQTSWLHLPQEVRLMILENLSNAELIKLQPTEKAEARAEAEVGGAYAIYEEG